MDDRYPVYVAPAETVSEVTEETVAPQSEEPALQPEEQSRKKRRWRRREKVEEAQPARPDTLKVEEPAPVPVVKKETPKPVQPKRYLIWSDSDVLKIKEQ